MNEKELRERAPTGIEKLDEMMEGGPLRGSVTLVIGAPGTGKTCLGLEFIAHGVEVGEPGLIVTFEHFPKKLLRDAASLGLRPPGYGEERHATHPLHVPRDILRAGSDSRAGYSTPWCRSWGQAHPHRLHIPPGAPGERPGQVARGGFHLYQRPSEARIDGHRHAGRPRYHRGYEPRPNTAYPISLTQ